MQRKSLLTIVLFCIFAIAETAYGQQPVNPAEGADSLRLQLLELQAKEEMLRLRLEELDQELKPENIERALAGIGSTKPEELREARRRRLTIEKTGVSVQLEIAQKNRSRLEVEMANAEARAYLESAAPAPTPTPVHPIDLSLATRGVMPPLAVLFTTVRSILVIVFAGFVLLACLLNASQTLTTATMEGLSNRYGTGWSNAPKRD